MLVKDNSVTFKDDKLWPNMNNQLFTNKRKSLNRTSLACTPTNQENTTVEDLQVSTVDKK